MKILLDHNLDRRLKDHRANHATKTTQEMGWANVLNGELLTLADNAGFEALLTADANIKDQQNLAGRKISIIILRAFDNRLSTHLEMIHDVQNALDKIRPAQIIEVFHP